VDREREISKKKVKVSDRKRTSMRPLMTPLPLSTYRFNVDANATLRYTPQFFLRGKHNQHVRKRENGTFALRKGVDLFYVDGTPHPPFHPRQTPSPPFFLPFDMLYAFRPLSAKLSISNIYIKLQKTGGFYKVIIPLNRLYFKKFANYTNIENYIHYYTQNYS
jgi:hypothetical protein